MKYLAICRLLSYLANLRAKLTFSNKLAVTNPSI